MQFEAQSVQGSLLSLLKPLAFKMMFCDRPAAAGESPAAGLQNP